jgi:hypothetical protein
VQNEIGEPFQACVQGGIGLGRSVIAFSKKAGRDRFNVKASFVTTVALDLAPGGTFFLSRNGTQFFSDDAAALKPNKKQTRFAGKGSAGLKRLKLRTKDKLTWSLVATGAKTDLSAVNTGTDETVEVGIQSHTAATPSGISPAGVAIFGGGGTFGRSKRQLKYPK